MAVSLASNTHKQSPVKLHDFPPLASVPSIVIRSSLCNYTIDFHGLTDLGTWHPEADLILTDAFFRGRISFPKEQPVIFVEATEAAKSLPQIIELFVALKQAGLGRGSRLLAVGVASFRTSPRSSPRCI